MKFRQYGHGVRVPKYVLTHPAYKRYDVDSLAKIAAAAMPLMKEHLDFPDDLTITVKPIKARDCVGLYNDSDKSITLDFRRATRYSLVSTLAHELIHSEQYHTGRLTRSYVNSDWAYQWEDSAVIRKGSTYKSYSQLPWEIEARDRQDGIALMVCDDLTVDGIEFNFYEGL